GIRDWKQYLYNCSIALRSSFIQDAITSLSTFIHLFNVTMMAFVCKLRNISQSLNCLYLVYWNDTN
ncbi:MAG: hypothetical protein ACSHXL_04030, partial [Bacteroidota bacterium]